MIASSMSVASLSLALGKVVVAAAWADGCIQAEERACIEDLLFYLPDLKPQDIHTLEMLLDYPLDPADSQRFIEDLLAKVETEQDKNLVLYAVGQLIRADGVITPEELALYQTLEAELNTPKPQLSFTLRNIFQGLVYKRQNRITTVLGAGADDITTCLDKKIAHLKREKTCRHLSETSLQKLLLEGILLAKIIWADGQVLESEIEKLLDYLKQQWNILPLEAPLLSAFLLDPSLQNLDLIRLCRAFFNLLLPQDKENFLTLMFELALADGVLSQNELDTILEISAHLKLGQDQFHHAWERYGSVYRENNAWRL